MSTMFDIPVTSMKLGVACPIPNNSFKFWDDPGTWIAPSTWSMGTGIVPTRTWDAYDGDRSMLKLQIVSAPDDFSRLVKSKGYRYWNANDKDLHTSAQYFYYSFAATYSVGGGGANARIGVQFCVGDDEDLTNKYVSTFKTWTSGSSSTLTLYTGTFAPLIVDGYDFGQWRVYFTDLAVPSQMEMDCLGVMFNPGDNSGYVALTNVYPVNGPTFAPENFLSTSRTPTGTMKRFDVSGGAVKYRMDFELRDENETTYQNLLNLWYLNSGVPGVAGYPLLIEPNIPALPPTLMVNFVGNSFPITRSTARARRYGGVLTFETVW
jgi:hypothetical protein